ncbi:MAG: glycosyltransferase family 4 protein [Chitinophagaceae bacterium]|nr:glycosyltransferase family 4 protein [Chitinophagaceae bacterium]
MRYKVLFLLHLPPPVHGSSMVGKWIHESKKINNTFSCSYINLLVSDTVGSSGSFSIKKVWKFIQIWFELLGQLIRKKPDLCYLALTTTGFAFYRDVMLVGLIKVFRVRRVYHLHNKGIKEVAPGGIRRRIYHYIFKGAEVILLSQYLYDDIRDFVPFSSVRICPNGIPPSECDLGSEKKEDGVIDILFLSNLIVSKGVLVLLDALKILDDKGLTFCCLFAGRFGDITETKFFDEVEVRRLQNKTRFLGGIYGREKHKILHHSDILVLPTYSDCFPLVLLEGMQHGLPLISTNEGGIPDIIEDGVTGFIVEKKNVHELADKLEKLILNKSLRTSMGDQGKKIFFAKFTLNHFETRLTDILDSLCKRVT